MITILTHIFIAWFSADRFYETRTPWATPSTPDWRTSSSLARLEGCLNRFWFCQDWDLIGIASFNGWLVVWSLFLFSPIVIGMMIQSDLYLSVGLKPIIRWENHRKTLGKWRLILWQTYKAPQKTMENSPSLIGTSTISKMGHLYHTKLLVYQGVCHVANWTHHNC